MGFKITWDIPSIAQQINSMSREVCSPYNDGFTQWPIKQDLYQLKWLIDDALARCPEFGDEQKWLKEQDAKRMWETLKK